MPVARPDHKVAAGSRRVVITGAGVVSPIGLGLDAFAENLLRGKSGATSLGPLFGMDASQFPACIGAPVPDDVVAPAKLGSLGATLHRSIHFAAHAIDQLVEGAAALRGGCDVSLVCGVGVGQLLPDLLDVQRLGAAHWLDAIERGGPAGGASADGPPNSLRPADHGTRLLQQAFDFRGHSQTMAGACSASTQACIQACEEVSLGDAPMAIGGGHDSLLCVPGMHLMHELGTLSLDTDNPTRAVKPFDVARDGTMIGEGAAYFLFEELEHALGRQAPILAEVLGYGSSLDGYHITTPDPQCTAGIRMINDALALAGIEPEQIDYVNAHGTGTLVNDPIEARILQAVFRGSRPYVSSSKAQVGHLIAACGAIELAACLVAVEHQTVPPNPNLRTPDPECDLNLPIGGAAPRARIDFVLSNSFGFGGQNSCVVLRRWSGR